MGHDLHFLHIGAETGGNRELMQARWGDRFYFMPYTKPHAGTGLTKRLRRFFKRMTLSIDDWYDPSLDKVLVSLSKVIQFDVVIVEYVVFSKALECFRKNVLKLVDTIDVFSNRHERMIGQGLQPGWYSASPQEEARGLNRADVVIAISEEDQRFLSGLTHQKVITLGHIVPLYEPIRQPSRTGKMLFVGSSNPMNVQAIRFFANEVLPRVKMQYPPAQLLIAGTICELLEDRDDWAKLGKIEDLRPVYTAVDLVINPMIFGTGLSIKSLEALGHAKPLVTTSNGARGLIEGEGDAYLVADTPDEFSSAVVSVLSDARRSEELSRKAYEMVVRWNRRNVCTLESLLNA